MIRRTPTGRLVHDLTHRGFSAWALSALLIAFYVVLYFGYDVYEPSGPFEQFQRWLFTHFTRHLDAAGPVLFAPVARALSSGAAHGILFGAIAAAAGWLAWFFRRDPGKLRAVGLATAVAAVAAVLFTRVFFVSSAWEALDASAFNRWHIYGLLYTLAIGVGGALVTWKYRHNAYQVVRTLVVMLVQVSFAFSVPILLKFFGEPEFYFSYLWPLKIDYLDPRNFSYYGEVLVLWGFIGSLLLVPVMTLLFGKRWYCSWVCGCGGLANTFGDPWRQLSSKSGRAWRLEKITIHTVLVIAVLSTALWFASAVLPESEVLARTADRFRTWYGWIVVASLSGAIGTGLYPVGGTRIWCRFFCPMAALLGLLQKLGRFRIRVKRDMCISCGMCSTYCEMGIDVRAYAQEGHSFTRASCVGCGLCAEVCPRGVLRLENRARRDPQELSWRSLVEESWR